MGWPGLAVPSTIPVATEAKCARGIREKLKIRGRSPVGIQKESNPIPGLSKGLPPRNIFQCFICDVDVVTEAIDRVSSIQEPSQEDPTGWDNFTCKGQLPYQRQELPFSACVRGAMKETEVVELFHQCSQFIWWEIVQIPAVVEVCV